MKAFDNIRQNVETEDTFVFVMIGTSALPFHLFQLTYHLLFSSFFFSFLFLIDEVESLSAARTMALQGNEPSDALRVVNAVLTQIDTLSKHNNVIVLATTNITEVLLSLFFLLPSLFSPLLSTTSLFWP